MRYRFFLRRADSIPIPMKSREVGSGTNVALILAPATGNALEVPQSGNAVNRSRSRR